MRCDAIQENGRISMDGGGGGDSPPNVAGAADPIRYFAAAYHNRVVKDKLMNEICEEIGCNQKQLGVKMKSLRTSFGRIVKTESGRSGQGANPKMSSRNKWLLDKLTFLRAYIKPRCSLSNLELEEVPEDTDSAGEAVEVTTPAELKEMTGSASNVAEQAQEQLEEEKLEQSVPKESKQELPKLPKRKKKSQEEEETNILKTISSTLASVSTSQKKDDVAIFLEHIGRQMRSIKSRRRQLLLENEIQQLVLGAVLEENDE